MELIPPDCINKDKIMIFSTNETLHVRDYVYEDNQMWVTDTQETADGTSQFLR